MAERGLHSTATVKARGLEGLLPVQQPPWSCWFSISELTPKS